MFYKKSLFGQGSQLVQWLLEECRWIATPQVHHEWLIHMPLGLQMLSDADAQAVLQKKKTYYPEANKAVAPRAKSYCTQ